MYTSTKKADCRPHQSQVSPNTLTYADGQPTHGELPQMPAPRGNFGDFVTEGAFLTAKVLFSFLPSKNICFIFLILHYFSIFAIMNKEKDIIRKGKHLAFLLRHDQEAFDDGRIDHHGWRMVAELLELGYTHSELDEIVATNDKQRYEYSPDGRKIRARQGHSIPVDVELKEVIPPGVLYHGTATRFLSSIYKEGLIPGNRLYVHLSPDKETAMKVGSRHGTPYVICLDCKRMVSDGCKFWKSNNGVWLTEEVNPKYFKENDR